MSKEFDRRIDRVRREISRQGLKLTFDRVVIKDREFADNDQPCWQLSVVNDTTHKFKQDPGFK